MSVLKMNILFIFFISPISLYFFMLLLDTFFNGNSSKHTSKGNCEDISSKRCPHHSGVFQRALCT